MSTRPRLHNFATDQDAAAGVIITIAGLTVTLGGLLAWFFLGSFMIALHNVPEVGGTIAFFGVIALVGVAVVLVFALVRR